MTEEKTTILTESGLKKLEEQLDYLISVRRNEVSEQIAIARGFGDLSENAEYDEAKKEQARVEAEAMLARERKARVESDARVFALENAFKDMKSKYDELAALMEKYMTSQPILN